VADNQQLPKVSFIIPTFNSERTIGRCLDSIVKQNYPALEIVIADGGSHDATVKICSKFTQKIFFDNGPLGHARQTGADNSNGEILAIFDSDIILPSPNWLREAVEQFKKYNNVGVVWPINKAPGNASLVSRCYFNFWNKRLEEKQDALPGGNSLILREAFEKVNGFNTRLHFGEDMDLAHRVVCQGYQVVILNWPVIHDSMHTLTQFTRKQLWGASSLLDMQPKESEGDLLYKCITWKSTGKKNPSTGHILKGIFSSQILTGLRAIISGVGKDKEFSLVVLPLLLGIRTGIYGIFFFKKITKKVMY